MLGNKGFDKYREKGSLIATPVTIKKPLDH